MNPEKDYYAILGVLPEAETEVIRAVYLALAKKYHPDGKVEGGDSEKLKEINEAYEVLHNPSTRKNYDALRAEKHEPTGDYEPNVDDQDLYVDDFKDDWDFAVEYCPQLADLLREIAAISPTMSIVFQSTILTTKRFNDAEKIRDQLVSAFVQRYFGKSMLIQRFATQLLQLKEMKAAKELNKAARIFGDSIDADTIIAKISAKYGAKGHWPLLYEGANFVLSYKLHGIYQTLGEGFIVCSEPNKKAEQSRQYSSLETAKDFVDFILARGI